MPSDPRVSPGAAWWFAVGTLTIFPVPPVRADRSVVSRAMSLAPFVGMALGVAGSAVFVVAWAASGSSLIAAVLAVGTLAWLTRALHLDGLADLADGLGSGKPAQGALDVMKRSDIGPFGVVTILITLFLQVATLQRAGPFAWPMLVTAATTGRLAVTWACRAGVPAARPGGLGALVAGAVGRGAAVAAAVATAAAVGVLALVAISPPHLDAVSALIGFAQGSPSDHSGPSIAAENVAVAVADVGVRPAGLLYRLSGDPRLSVTAGLLLAMAAGLVSAALLRRRAVRRLGGITGDVLGALVETATTATLLAAAVLV
ncbi:adenosylcobinamide-GDP ribazoletransferase [Microbispora sp. H10670]|uniref:adenosylcobinamide-GDP ribazoletransferase n=1 Tax=Microbispora sp. H10670 TaxID=2729108 RepID=UPI001602FE59|nr:adenosylcobinamide-GDP ribazoletransferase [Microbispora sp. H10670]